MSTAAPASLLRHSLARRALHSRRSAASKRFASSTTEASQKKAQDALATAQKNASKFYESAKRFLEPAGEKVGNLLGSYKQPLLYNLSVTREVLKQIYVKEGLQPPNFATVKAAYSNLWSQVANPALVGNLVKSGEIGRVGIYGLQAYGIFKIGEIVGRRSVIGYNIE
ncbi:hypothetical protein GALMADRAFT_74382 [Galerina marginata CBS 339.88]|uniref:Uncharacterized protein n=1 Tax=Galerina marginata (strain CBS 339.88) TaxID=685588 RepID=A0A067SZF0_GALM3|nr:hypothetical protein GALMADRAFT_74382 [Galerina marginata CBS 339.88]